MTFLRTPDDVSRSQLLEVGSCSDLLQDLVERPRSKISIRTDNTVT